MTEKILRTTRGACPVCIRIVDAAVIEVDGKVFIEKDCPDHGKQRALISVAPDYYCDLADYYFDLMDRSHPQRDYIIRLTARCNMACPICLAGANDYEEIDLPPEELKRFLQGRRKTKLDLMGAEPTQRDDLEPIIRYAHEQGHITALHTNGIAIGDRAYFRTLVNAGLDEVHLQFDSFDDDHYQVLRGRPMVEVNNRALASLEEFSVSTDLVVTVMRDLNEDQMGKIFDFATRRDFVKEVFFLGCRRLGRATMRFADRAYAPDELIDQLERQTGGRLNREDIRVFQKLYFALLRLFSVRKCFYIHHYMVLRTKDGWRPVGALMDLNYLEPRLERFRSYVKASRIIAGGYLVFHVLVAIVKKGGFGLLSEGFVLLLMLMFGFDLSKIQRKSLLLGFITACDPWIHDERVAANCGKGEVATDIGLHDSGADANVEREKVHRQIDRGSPF